METDRAGCFSTDRRSRHLHADDLAESTEKPLACLGPHLPASGDQYADPPCSRRLLCAGIAVSVGLGLRRPELPGLLRPCTGECQQIYVYGYSLSWVSGNRAWLRLHVLPA